MLIQLAIFIFLCLLMSLVLGRVWLNENANKHYYIFPMKERPVNTFEGSMKLLVSFYLLLNGLLPLDLVVCFMLGKLMYTYFVEVDTFLIETK